MKHYALLGENLSHSYSKLIHEYLFQKFNISADYSLWQVPREKIHEVFELAEKNNIAGFNITVPYKEILLSQIEQIDPTVKNIGAINTVIYKKIWKAYNTDCFGFEKMLEYFSIPIKNKKIIILGTGGAAKAVGEALQKKESSSILFVSRTPKQKNQIAYEKIPKSDILINATPLGMYPDTKKSPVSENVFSGFNIAIDLIYNPSETMFLREAKKKHLQTYNGLFMLVAQAIRAQEIWQNTKYPKELYSEVYNYLEEILYENNDNSRS